MKVKRAGTSNFPHTQMPSKAQQKAGCPGEDSTARARQSWDGSHGKSLYKDGGHRGCWEKTDKRQRLPKAGQSRTRLKVIRSDINQESLQIAVLGLHLGLQKKLLAATISS